MGLAAKPEMILKLLLHNNNSLFLPHFAFPFLYLEYQFQIKNEWPKYGNWSLGSYGCAASSRMIFFFSFEAATWAFFFLLHANMAGQRNSDSVCAESSIYFSQRNVLPVKSYSFVIIGVKTSMHQIFFTVGMKAVLVQSTDLVECYVDEIMVIFWYEAVPILLPSQLA